MNIPFSKVDCSGNEAKYVNEVLESGWLTTASKTASLEARFKEAIGVSHALAVNSCTAGLHLVLEAMGIGEGDRVIVPSLTFTASAEVIRYVGADPLFVDVDENTGLLTPEILRAAIKINPDVKACIVVHFGGQSAELDGNDGILSLCKEHGIKLIQDAAHAFPSSDTYGPVGSIGDATCFSFYANKTITTAEGGMIVTNDGVLADRIKVMRLHGINRDVWDRFTSDKPSWEYDVVAPGFKYNMPDLNAAVGLAQFERAEEFRVERMRCAERYMARLSGVDGVRFFRNRVPFEQHSWHLFPIVISPNVPVTRNDLIHRLAEDGIGVSVHYKPLHRMTYYRERYSLSTKDFPNTERYWRGCLSLPIYPSLTNDDIDYVVDRLCKHIEF